MKDGCSDIEFSAELCNSSLNQDLYDNELFMHLSKHTCQDIEIDCKYYNENQFVNVFNVKDGHELSVFHVNIRSLNCNYRSLVMFLHSLEFKFDILILSEIWSYNSEFLHKIFPSYDFHYNIPKSSKIGGIEIFIKNSISHSIRKDLKLENVNALEDLWLEINNGHSTY